MKGQLNQNPFFQNPFKNTETAVSEYPSTSPNIINNIIPIQDNLQLNSKLENINFINSSKVENLLNQNDPLAQTALFGTSVNENNFGQVKIDGKTEIKSNITLPEFGGTNPMQNQNLNLNQFLENKAPFNISEYPATNIQTQNQIMPPITSSPIVLPLLAIPANNIGSSSPITNINNNLQNNINMGITEVASTIQEGINNIGQINPMSQDNKNQNTYLTDSYEIVDSQTEKMGFPQSNPVPNASLPFSQQGFLENTNNTPFETQIGNTGPIKVLPTITLKPTINKPILFQNQNPYSGEQMSLPNTTASANDANNETISPNIFELKNKLQNIDLSSSYIIQSNENTTDTTNLPSNLGNNTFPMQNTQINNISTNMTPLEFNNFTTFTSKPTLTLNTSFPSIETKPILPDLGFSQNMNQANQFISSNTVPLGAQNQNQNQILSNSNLMRALSSSLNQSPYTMFSQNTFMNHPNQTLNTLPINGNLNTTMTNILPTQNQNPYIISKINPPIYLGATPSQTISPNTFPLESNINNPIISPTINTSMNLAQNQITTLPSTVIPLKNYNSSTSPALNTSLTLSQNPITTYPSTTIQNVNQNNTYNISSYSASNTSNTFQKPQITTFPSTVIPLDATSSPISPYNISSYNANQNGLLAQSNTMPNPLNSNINQIPTYTNNSIYQNDPIQTSMNYSQNYSINSNNLENKIPKNLRTETEIVPVEEIDYIPVKKLKYVKRTKVFVPKIRKVYIPVKKKIIVPVKKKIYVPVNSNNSIQYNTGSLNMNNSQAYNTMSNYSNYSNYSNMNANDMPYNSSSIKSNNFEVDNEKEINVPLNNNIVNPSIQLNTSINPPLPFNTLSHTSNILNTSMQSIQSGIGSPIRQSYIHTGAIYKPKTYAARSLSNRRLFF